MQLDSLCFLRPGSPGPVSIQLSGGWKSMQRMSRILWMALCLAVLAATGAVRAQEEEEALSPAVKARLRAAYEAFNRDTSVKALEKQANGNLRNREVVDALLKSMPLSPLEYWQIDME